MDLALSRSITYCICSAWSETGSVRGIYRLVGGPPGTQVLDTTPTLNVGNCSWVDQGTLYFGGGGNGFGKALHSTTDGTTWTNLSANLPVGDLTSGAAAANYGGVIQIRPFMVCSIWRTNDRFVMAFTLLQSGSNLQLMDGIGTFIVTLTLPTNVTMNFALKPSLLFLIGTLLLQIAQVDH